MFENRSREHVASWRRSEDTLVELDALKAQLDEARQVYEARLRSLSDQDILELIEYMHESEPSLVEGRAAYLLSSGTLAHILSERHFGGNYGRVIGQYDYVITKIFAGDWPASFETFRAQGLRVGETSGE